MALINLQPLESPPRTTGNVQGDLPILIDWFWKAYLKIREAVNSINALDFSVEGKQDTLVSGTNIKTINGNNLLGEGDVTISTTSSWGSITGSIASQTDLQAALAGKANVSHTHIISDVTGLQDALDGKVSISAFAEGVDDRVASLLLAGSGISLVYDDSAGTLTISASLPEYYETVSKNLKSFPYTLNYSGGNLSTVVYDLGGGDSITKTFSYSGSNLTSVVLSGDTPAGIDLTKTLSYTGSDLTSVSYS